MNFPLLNAFNSIWLKIGHAFDSFRTKINSLWLEQNNEFGSFKWILVSIRLQLPYEWKCWRLYSKLCTKAFSWKASCVIIITYKWNWLHVCAMWEYGFSVRKPHSYGLPAIQFEWNREKRKIRFSVDICTRKKKHSLRYEALGKSFALCSTAMLDLFSICFPSVFARTHSMSVCGVECIETRFTRIALCETCFVFSRCICMRMSDLAHNHHNVRRTRAFHSQKKPIQAFMNASQWMYVQNCLAKFKDMYCFVFRRYSLFTQCVFFCFISCRCYSTLNSLFRTWFVQNATDTSSIRQCLVGKYHWRRFRKWLSTECKDIKWED